MKDKKALGVAALVGVFTLLGFVSGALALAWERDVRIEKVEVEKVKEVTRQVSFNPISEDASDFYFNWFYLGSTRAAVQKECAKKGGRLSGVNPDAEAGTPFPSCFVESRSGADVGYYPVYWPDI